MTAIRPGDSVRVRLEHWPEGQWASGPAVPDPIGQLRVCDFVVGDLNYEFTSPRHHTVEVIDWAAEQ